MKVFLVPSTLQGFLSFLFVCFVFLEATQSIYCQPELANLNCVALIRKAHLCSSILIRSVYLQSEVSDT